MDEVVPGLRRAADEGEAISSLKLDPLTERYLVLRLMAELDLFVGNTPQHDDVTCMLLKAETG